jgi:glycosyltransferase involved in cell wall biosynthesis
MASVAAIVPAYNEAPRIGAVLAVLTKSPSISEVIVVDDGSTDSTSDIARLFPVKVIRRDKNLGKGSAMELGVAATTADIIFFSDADVRGLTIEIVEYIIDPVRRGAYDMFIGIHDRTIYKIPFVLRQLPHIGGERALRRETWNTLPLFFKKNFRIEVGLNFWTVRHGKGFGYHAFPELIRTIKEHKYGLAEGFRRRIGMIFDITLAYLCVIGLKLKGFFA